MKDTLPNLPYLYRTAYGVLAVVCALLLAWTSLSYFRGQWISGMINAEHLSHPSCKIPPSSESPTDATDPMLNIVGVDLSSVSDLKTGPANVVTWLAQPTSPAPPEVVLKQIESEWKLTGVKVERLGGALIAQVGQNFLYQARIVKQEESKEGIATICRLDSRQKEEAGNQPLPKSSQGLLPLLAPDSVLASAGKEDTPGYTVVFRIPEAPLPATAHFCAQLRDLGWRAFEAQPETSADRKTGVSTYCHDKTGFGLILSISPDTTNANITCASLSLF